MYTEGSKVIPVDIEKEMRKSFLDYSMSVIVSRALPDVRDGLKPVHRRILYTLHENGLTPDKAYRKSADTVGSVLGRYHPHGDASVYDALVRMAQDFSLRYPLVDGHGNFGSIDGDGAAAYRYTEARMSKIATEMLTDIDKETVDFMPNYDDRLQEPVVLPTRFPTLLVNGSAGIAVGMATNIPPHNLGEVIDGIKLLIDNPDATTDEINEAIKGPDFPTGGIIMGRSGIRAAYATGRGKITLRARAEIDEDDKGKLRIIVTEIPYAVNKQRLIEHIAELVRDKRIDGISKINDESGRDGMRIVIDLKREANPQVTLNKLYSYTQLQETVGVIMLALHDGQPKVMGIKEILEHYIDFQCDIVTRRTKYDLRKAQERAHILEGLKIALDEIDEVINILRSSKSIPEGKERLIERFGLDDVQASAIVAMTLGKLTGLERSKIEEELENLQAKIKEFEGILADHQLVLDIVKTEVEQVGRKYADERRTEIQSISGEVDIEDLIPVEESVVTLTNFGYIKRQPVDTYKLQKRGGRGVSGIKQRDEDFVKELFISSSHDNVLFVTSKGRMFKLKCYEIPEGSKQSRGMNIVNLLNLEEGEKVTTMINIKEFDEESFLVMVTRKGMIKRTALSAYKNIRRNGLIAIGLMEDDELNWVAHTSGNDEIFIATRNGMSIRVAENTIRPLSRTAKGVRAIKLREGDCVVGMVRLDEGKTVFTVTDKGQGKRTNIESYNLQKRGGFGKINYKVNDVKGYVASIAVVSDEDDMLLVSDDGIIIRIRVSDVGIMSRYASGVRVMRLGEGSTLVTGVVTEHDEDEEVEAVEQGSGEDMSEEEIKALEAQEASQPDESEPDDDETEE